SSFSEEKEAKRLSFRLPPSPGTAGRSTEKVFWFFFFKKERFLFSLPNSALAAESERERHGADKGGGRS
ncbi:hypothetical protein NON00_24275, partial [Roseomonas sp. GC11]|uniref:hypothetical protein n=1 Tax=Roseomonas sp. GC11 TaxID=2950546 RepID=UPI00210C4E4B